MASSPSRWAGESCGNAELKKRSVSCIGSAISESKICGESRPGSDEGKRSVEESMAKKAEGFSHGD